MVGWKTQMCRWKKGGHGLEGRWWGGGWGGGWEEKTYLPIAPASQHSDHLIPLPNHPPFERKRRRRRLFGSARRRRRRRREDVPMGVRAKETMTGSRSPAEVPRPRAAARWRRAAGWREAAVVPRRRSSVLMVGGCDGLEGEKNKACGGGGTWRGWRREEWVRGLRGM